MAAAMERGILEAEGLMSVVDPDSSPYQSKYKARKIITGLLGLLGERDLHQEDEAKEIVAKLFKNLGEEASELGKDGNHDLQTMDERKREWLGRLHHLLAVNLCETEEGSRSKPFLKRARACLEPSAIKYCVELVEVYNYIGINASNRQDFKEGKTVLKLALDLYRDAKKKGGLDKEREKELESKHTLSLFYLAQVEGHLGNGSESAKHLALTLHRQLSGDIDVKEWIQNALSIAGFHINEARYVQAKNCLQAAQKVFTTRWKVPEDKADNEEREEMQAYIYRTWAAMHLHRLRGAVPEEDFEDYFSSLKLPEAKNYPACNDFQTAREIFLEGMEYLNKAQDFFVLDGFVTDHIKIVQEKSQYWKHLSVMEPDLRRRAKMHKRRITLLRPILHEISASAYGNEISQLSDEVASSYMSILEIKEQIFPKLPTDQRLKAVNKINKLAHAAILYYRLFVRGFHKDFGPDPPDKMEADYVKHYLTGRFFIARLYGKIIGDSIPATCKLSQCSLEEYKTIVKLAEKYKVEHFKDELDICKEMVSLLPAKIANWQRRAIE